MKESILEFINVLRGSGIRISTEETLDCMTGLEYVDLSSRDTFRFLLRTSLVKKGEDLPTFDKLFDLFFKSFQLPDEQLQSPMEQTEMPGPVQEILEQLNGLVSPSLRELILQGLPMLASALMEAGNRAGIQDIRYPLQTSHFVQKLRKEFGMESWPQELAHFDARLEEEGIPASVRESLAAELAERIRLFEEMIRDFVDRQVEVHLPKQKFEEPNAELMEKSFGSLNNWEIKSMQCAVQELAKKIRDEASLRQRRNRKGP